MGAVISRYRERRMTDSKLVVAYWSIRGLAAPLRMMCHHANVEFEDTQYPLGGEPGNWDASAWFGVKPALKEKNALMNLPYVIDGDTVVTQSNACLSYLGRKFGITQDVTKMEQVLAQVMDLRNDAVEVFYRNWDSHENHCSKNVPTHYGKLNGWLEQQGTAYVAGDEPSPADFHLWEMIDQHEALARALE